MGLVCCVAKVHTFKDIEYDVEDLESGVDFLTYRLPTELLLKIMCYLPTRDKIMMRYVSRRLKHVSEIPLLWEEFVWPDYEPHHLRQVSDTLKTYGDRVRRILFPAHVCLAPMKVLEMGRCCTKVMHLSLSKTTQLTLDHLEEILCIMTHLQQLDLCIDGSFMECTPCSVCDDKFLGGLFKITAGRVRKLKLQINNYKNSVNIIAKLRKWATEAYYPLPSIIDILTVASKKVDYNFWSELSSKLLPFEIGLYDNKIIPMNLYLPMPLRKFRVGPAATPPLIQLNNHGITGLRICYLNEYDIGDAVRYTISPIGILSADKYGRVHRIFDSALLCNAKLFNRTNHLHAVSYADMSYSDIRVSNLEQLAVVCPNLQRLNLKGNIGCLAHLKGLIAIVHACQNLEGLNLAGIQSISLRSYLDLWELLSSIKRLTHLAIDLCMLKPIDSDHKGCLIDMLKRCHSLKALELHCVRWCSECSTNKDFIFSHFPSLTYCRLSDFVYSGLKYAITNCHKLKYLYEEFAFEELENLLPLSSVCHLQQLYIDSLNATYFNVTDELTHALSAHGGLECVVLHVNTITFSSLITLIKNSPNLVLLHVSSNEELFGESCQKLYYKEKAKEMFSYHKLFAIGSFKVCVAGTVCVDGTSSQHVVEHADLFNTDLNSLWV